MDWKHGYFANSGYVYGYYPELMPSRLYWAALLQGHLTPIKQFRYLDAGCGQGMSLLFAAAAYPDSEFVGIDFMPEHIAHAKRIAREAGLTNVTFLEADFIDLAENANDYSVLQQGFDYVVCHGITTWISPVVRTALFKFISHVLGPGGVFYNSYNTLPGWLGTSPLQHLVFLQRDGADGQTSLLRAQAIFEQLLQADNSLFADQPGLLRRLELIKKQDPAYLQQEYNNEFWQPMYFSDMYEALSGCKLNHLGTATLSDIFYNLLADGVQKLLKEQKTLLLREQLRDYAVNQSFRRDLFVKGVNKLWPGLQKNLIDQFRFIRNPLVQIPAFGDPYLITGSSVLLNSDPETFGRILGLFSTSESGTMLSDVLKNNPDPTQRQAAIQAVSLLMQGGWLMPGVATDECLTSNGSRLNKVLSTAISHGAPYKHLCLPKAGTALSISDTEWILLRCVQQQVPKDQWITFVIHSLFETGRAILRDGQPLTGEALRDFVINVISEFDTERLPFYQGLNAV